MDLIPKTTNNKSLAVAEESTAATTDDILRHLAFDNAAQANIISTVSSGKIVMVNGAACKLLGYSKKELLTKDLESIFDIKDSNFKEMLKERTAKGHSIARVTVFKKTGKPIPCEITSAIFMDENGIETSITSIVNMSQSIKKQKNIDIKKNKVVAINIVLAKSEQIVIDIQKEKIVADNITEALAKSEAKLAENNEWIKYIARASYDVMWDWNIATGEIYVGDSIAEVFGYKVKNNIMNFIDFIGYLIPGDRNKVEKKLSITLASGSKSWNDAFLFRRHDGTVASTTCRASIVRDEDGKAIRLIGAFQDVSRLQDLEKKLEDQISIKKDQNEIFHLAAKLSYDGIWDWNLLTNDFFLGDGFEELFGQAIKNSKGNMTDWSKHLHPDDKNKVEKGLQDAIASSANKWEDTYRFIKADGSVAEVIGRASIIRDANGKAYHIIGAVHDISKQKVLEEQIEHEIKLKEKLIADALEDAKDTERADIGKELHDNINQLLAASRMFLNMAKGGGLNSEMYLNRSSEYTLTAIEEIRKLTKGLTTDTIKNLGLCDAIEKIAHDMMEGTPVKIFHSLSSFIESTVTDKFKLNIFRIVQEQLNNILKHANATRVSICLSQNEKNITLSITDNGVGFDTAEKRAGIGIDNIKSRAVSYSGTADFVSQPGKGCILTVTLPVLVSAG